MTGVLIYGFTIGNFSAEGAKLLAMPWGIVSMVDLYVGFTLFSCWIVFREKGMVAFCHLGVSDDGHGVLDRSALYSDCLANQQGRLETFLVWKEIGLMSEPPPVFVYHPDPVRTGSVEVSDEVCIVCGQARGYIYVGPVYAAEDLDSQICPWCIADGSAYEKFGASFTDEECIGGNGLWDEVPETVVEVVASRTPGFSGWQQEQWWTHCGDAAVFIGIVGYEELALYGEQALTAIAKESGFAGEDLDIYMQALSKKGSPTAYLFQCRHCGACGGYSDSD